jgi:hypothetical protein
MINADWKDLQLFGVYITEISFSQTAFHGTVEFREEISIIAKYFALDFTDILLTFSDTALFLLNCVSCTSQTWISSA